MKRTGFVVGLLLLLLVLAACKSIDGPAIEIVDAWGWPSPKVAAAGAFYMLIKNTGNEADRLTSGESSACGVIELHESYMMEDGVMGMRPIAGGTIEIPAGSEARLKMGGMHLMCIEMLEEFSPGVQLPLTLNFETSGAIKVAVEIREP